MASRARRVHACHTVRAPAAAPQPSGVPAHTHGGAVTQHFADSLHQLRSVVAHADHRIGTEFLGVREYRPGDASSILSRNLLVYGLGGIVAPFIGIKLIDLVVSLIPGF